ncbi:hypothetical protein VUJ46_19495 [Chryseobacterium sp. MYb264]|uniref:hypothetical protein n=1 Tax=Chryseobacterium sp. MYb264 TaxID=2745153 RepID=UPI002E0FEA67|nr:hypothetical protein VUJ46_19495 [Chryseobacterium sp. MYb264]
MKILFFSLLYCFVYSQHHSAEEADQLLERSFEYHKKYNDLKELEYAKKAASMAEKSDDSKRKAESYYRLSCALSSLELQRESFMYIKKASEEKYTRKNIFLQAQLKDIKANNYLNLNLISQYKREISGIIHLLKDKKDLPSLRLLQRVYVNIAGNLPEEKKDSAFYYYQKSSDILKNLPEKLVYKDLCNLNIFKGTAFLERKEMDSAWSCFQKSLELRKKYKDSILVLEHIKLGDYYFSMSDKQQALAHYLNAIENIKNHGINTILFNDVYLKTANLYEELGDEDKYNEYQEIYSNSESKIRTERINNVDAAINTVLTDKQDEYQFSQEKKRLWIIGGITVLLLLFFILFRILQKNLQLKETLINEAESSLQMKDDLIQQKSMEKEELQIKIGDVYKEVSILAQKNDPSFYFRFQEVYPEFQKKMLELYPGLRNTELILCAYIFLGFTIKDIAEYTFKSVNTIRNRKQNLRKKFSIPTETDMQVWLKTTIYGH